MQLLPLLSPPRGILRALRYLPRMIRTLVILTVLIACAPSAIACLHSGECPAGECCLYTRCSAANCGAAAPADPPGPVLRAGLGAAGLVDQHPVAAGLALLVILLQRAATALVGRLRRRGGALWSVLGRLSSATWADAPGSLKAPLARQPAPAWTSPQPAAGPPSTPAAGPPPIPSDS